MNITPIIAPLAVVLVAAGTVTASATGAFAATPTTVDATAATVSASAHHGHLAADATLQQIQAAAATATAKRITKLQAAITKVTNDKTLTASDRSILLATLNADLTGMQQQQRAVAADTTTARARSDYQIIFSKYRVFDIALPQERIVRAADRVAAKTLPHLQTAEQKLSERLGRRQNADTAAAKNALTDLQQQISSIQSDSAGLDASALALTPAQFDQSHSGAAAVEAKAKQLRTAERAAHHDIQTIRQALHG